MKNIPRMQVVVAQHVSVRCKGRKGAFEDGERRINELLVIDAAQSSNVCVVLQLSREINLGIADR